VNAAAAAAADNDDDASADAGLLMLLMRPGKQTDRQLVRRAWLGVNVADDLLIYTTSLSILSDRLSCKRGDCVQV